MANTYDRDESVRVFATFKSTAGVVADPTTVRLRYRKPGSTATVLTYSTASGDITRSSTGQFYSDLTADTAGQWIYQWDSSGVIQASYEKSFRVRAGL